MSHRSRKCRHYKFSPFPVSQKFLQLTVLTDFIKGNLLNNTCTCTLTLHKNSQESFFHVNQIKLVRKIMEPVGDTTSKSLLEIRHNEKRELIELLTIFTAEDTKKIFISLYFFS